MLDSTCICRRMAASPDPPQAWLPYAGGYNERVFTARSYRTRVDMSFRLGAPVREMPEIDNEFG